MFAKVSSQIFDSSIAEDPQLRLTFIDLLLLCDPNGVVDMTQEAIARRTNRPTELIREHLVRLSSPDPRSRTPDHDGRRIALLDDHRDWGWVIVNYERFRMVESSEQRREKTRERVAKFRSKTPTNTDIASPCNAPVTHSNACNGKQKQKQKQKEKEKQIDEQLSSNTPSLAALAESVYSVYPKKVGRDGGAGMNAAKMATSRFSKEHTASLKEATTRLTPMRKSPSWSRDHISPSTRTNEAFFAPASPQSDDCTLGRDNTPECGREASNRIYQNKTNRQRILRPDALRGGGADE